MKKQVVCPRCRAVNVGSQTHCLLCWAELPAAGSRQETAFGQQIVPPNQRGDRPMRDAYPTGRAMASPLACLTLVRGSGSPSYVDLPPSGLTIGRSSSNGLVLGDDSLVSRQHARLDYAGGVWVLSDVGSRNGTFVNGTRVMRQTLRPGDQIQIGQTVWVFQPA